MYHYSRHVPPTCDLQLKDVIHVVLIPVYKEPIDKLRETLDTLKAQGDGMARQIVVVIATEERDTGGALMARQLHREYGPCFRELYCTMHRLERGELVGKSSNENWAARCIKHRLVDQMGMVGVLGEHVGSKAREVYYTWEEYQAGKEKALGDARETEEEPGESDIPLESPEEMPDNESSLEDTEDFEEDEAGQETSEETTELDDDQ